MPVIFRAGRVKVYVYADDRQSPHSHVVSPEGEAVLLPADHSMLVAEMDSQILALVWAWAWIDELTFTGLDWYRQIYISGTLFLLAKNRSIASSIWTALTYTVCSSPEFKKCIFLSLLTSSLSIK